MLLQQYSLDHKSGHAHLERGACTTWLFADGFANRRKPALSIHPPCVSTVEMWFDGLNLYCMYSLEYGTRRFYLYSLTECRSPNSPLLVPVVSLLQSKQGP